MKTITAPISSVVKETKSFLAQIEPFRGLLDVEREKLALAIQEHQYAKGENIFVEGENANSAWILKSGRLEIYKFNSEGKLRAIESIIPGEFFGTLCRMGGGMRSYPCTAVAAEKSVSLQIQFDVFLEVLKNSNSMVSGVCVLCSQRLNYMRDLSCVSQEPVEKRIAKMLLDLSKKHGLILPYTKREIGEFAGTTVETTIRTISKFQKKKWIHSERGRITLTDPGSIRTILD